MNGLHLFAGLEHIQAEGFNIQDHDPDRAPLAVPLAVYARPARKERQRSKPWTEEEHRNFLIGMKVLGTGNWKGVSQVYVPTRTPPQIASHAQKYFMRIGEGGRKRARPSLFDLEIDDLERIIIAKQSAPGALLLNPGLGGLGQGQEGPGLGGAAAAEPGAAAAAHAAQEQILHAQTQSKIRVLQLQIARLERQQAAAGLKSAGSTGEAPQGQEPGQGEDGGGGGAAAAAAAAGTERPQPVAHSDACPSSDPESSGARSRSVGGTEGAQAARTAPELPTSPLPAPFRASAPPLAPATAPVLPLVTPIPIHSAAQPLQLLPATQQALNQNQQRAQLPFTTIPHPQYQQQPQMQPIMTQQHHRAAPLPFPGQAFPGNPNGVTWAMGPGQGGAGQGGAMGMSLAAAPQAGGMGMGPMGGYQMLQQYPANMGGASYASAQSRFAPMQAMQMQQGPGGMVGSYYGGQPMMTYAPPQGQLYGAPGMNMGLRQMPGMPQPQGFQAQPMLGPNPQGRYFMPQGVPFPQAQ